jgi:hypothetical protein
VLDILQRLSPELLDAILALIGFQGQMTTEPKSETAPNKVFEAIQGYDKVEGDFGNLAIPSLSDLLDKNPPLKWGAIAATTLGAAALAMLGKQGNG